MTRTGTWLRKVSPQSSSRPAIRRPAYMPTPVPSMLTTNAVIMPMGAPSHQPTAPPTLAPRNVRILDIVYRGSGGPALRARRGTRRRASGRPITIDSKAIATKTVSVGTLTITRQKSMNVSDSHRAFTSLRRQIGHVAANVVIHPSGMLGPSATCPMAKIDQHFVGMLRTEKEHIAGARRYVQHARPGGHIEERPLAVADRKSTRLNSSHVRISYAVFCLKKKKKSLVWPLRSLDA